MIYFDPKLDIYIAVSPVDFRAGINRLVAIAQATFEKEPSRGGIFVFKNRRGTDIKLILYDRNGFFLGHKRLSKGKLKWWPRSAGESLAISSEELNRLLCGVDPRSEFHPDWQNISRGHGFQRTTQDRTLSSGAFQP